jgi:radical SAM protein with 4Fe4S-binding SPASM domain
MCWFYGDHGIGNSVRGKELSTKEVFKLIDQIAVSQPKIYFGGSEPFIRDDFLEILKYVKKNNLKVSFPTNGTLLNSEKIERIIAMNVNDMKFSIDGDEETHDYIRGKGVFKKATAALKELVTCKKKYGMKNPTITVNITITSEIVGRIQHVLNEVCNATDNLADFYRFHHLWYITENELSLHQSMTKRLLGASSLGASGHIVPKSKRINPEKIVHEIMALKGQEQIKFFPNFRRSEVMKFYTEGSIVKPKCYAPFLAAIIKPNGDLRFCPDEWIDDYYIGNVRTESFDKIWDSPQARKFREVLLKQKCFPACKRCSWMYSF